MSKFKVKKELVVAAANNALTKNDSIRKAHFEKEVQRHMKQWRILHVFGVKPLSREAAEAYVEKHSSVMATWRIQGWGTRAQAENLLSACAVTESELVELSTDDATFVREWKGGNP